MRSKTYKSFEELAKGIKYDEQEALHEYLTNGEWKKAFEYIEKQSLAELQKHPLKKEISNVLYQMFKTHFSLLEFDLAKSLINNSYEVSPHNNLIKERRSLFMKRTSKFVNSYEAVQNIAVRPQRKEPSFKHIKESHSLGTVCRQNVSD